MVGDHNRQLGLLLERMMICFSYLSDISGELQYYTDTSNVIIHGVNIAYQNLGSSLHEQEISDTAKC
jgi:hypothetical protein